MKPNRTPFGIWADTYRISIVQLRTALDLPETLGESRRFVKKNKDVKEMKKEILSIKKREKLVRQILKELSIDIEGDEE